MSSITIPDGYGYVLLALSSFAWLNGWQVSRVGRARKIAKIAYPQTHAEKAQMDASKDAYIFNCAQRAHANTLETMPTVILSTLITGLKYPMFAATCAGLWTFGRVLYTIGYLTGVPKRRNTWGGGLGPAVGYILVLTSSWAAYQLTQGN